MKVIFKQTNADPVFLMRRAGYGFEKKDRQTGENVFSRRLSGYQYPKFHIYASKEKDALIINLHLDQKKPSYEGATMHSGEYDGEAVEKEAERIKIIIKNLAV